MWKNMQRMLGAMAVKYAHFDASSAEINAHE
jgi:hypothetical protein